MGKNANASVGTRAVGVPAQGVPPDHVDTTMRIVIGYLSNDND